MYVVIGGTNNYDIPYAYGIYHTFDNAIEGALELYKITCLSPSEDIETIRKHIREYEGYENICEISYCNFED